MINFILSSRSISTCATTLWEYLDAFGIHIPAVFKDIISDELMDMLLDYAMMRAW